jgi:hypothetical protein
VDLAFVGRPGVGRHPGFTEAEPVTAARQHATGTYRIVYVSYTLGCVPYLWLAATLAALHGVEPHEVLQALGAVRRLPGPTVGSDPKVLGIFARTNAGRPLVVTIRRSDGFDWWILGARDMTDDELATFEAWEATQ